MSQPDLMAGTVDDVLVEVLRVDDANKEAKLHLPGLAQNFDFGGNHKNCAERFKCFGAFCGLGFKILFF